MYRWEVPKGLARRLARIRDRTGVPVTRQLRRAVDEDLDEHHAPAAPGGARALPDPPPPRGRHPPMNTLTPVLIRGPLTRTPRLPTLPSGKTVCDFALALNRRWLDINGDSHQETTFVDVTAWNQQGE